MLNTDLCPCGSGLRRLRCCEADPACLPGSAALALLTPQAEEAAKLYNEKKYTEAAELAQKLLDLAPNHRMAVRVLFEIRRAENKASATEALCRRLADLPAENNVASAAAHLQLAQLLIGQGRNQDAEPAASAAIKLTPRDASAHHVMGVILTETGHLPAGERHYRTALKLLETPDGLVMANLAWNLKLQGRLDESALLYATALELRPENARGVGGFAQVEAGRGHMAEAAALLDRALTTWPQDRTLRLLRALVDLQTGNAAAVLERLPGPVENLMTLELAVRGRAFAKQDKIAEAVASYAQCKFTQRDRLGQTYNPAEIFAAAETYKAFFTADRMLNLPRVAQLPGPQPIFLLGFSRSGTALLDQFLAKIPGFSTADAAFPISKLTPLVPRLAGSTALYPQALEDVLIGDGALLPAELRNQYYQALTAAGIVTPGTRYFTDRAPDNHWHLGLIKLLFPEAPIIHLLRHPLDIMLSNLAQDIRLEANCGIGMPMLARHYDAMMSMTAHYRTQLTLRYLPIRYEELVADPAAQLTSILRFLNLSPDLVPATATLHANAVQSAQPLPAYTSMQTPLYTSSLYRHAAYERELPALFSEVRPILDKWIDTLGYGLPA